MIKFEKSRIIVLLVMFFSLAGMMQADNAAAFDFKYIPGMACFANNGNQEQYLGHRHSGTLNRHSRNVKVTCPIIRDNRVANSTAAVAVWVVQDASRSTRCWLRTTDVDSTVTNTTARSRTGTGQLLWSPIGISSPYRGYTTVQCRLPPNARLYEFAYSENAGTDTN